MVKFIEELKKTSGADEVRLSDDGQIVVLMGWVDAVRDHGGAVFLDLRDRSGLVQIVLDSDVLDNAKMEVAKSLRQEYVVAVQGRVRKRAGKPNPNLATGQVEVVVPDVGEIFPLALDPTGSRLIVGGGMAYVIFEVD